MKYFLALIVFACGCVSGARDIDIPFGSADDLSCLSDVNKQMVTAINSGNCNQVASLINTADLGVVDSKGNTFLHLAVRMSSNSSIVALFLNKALLQTRDINVNAQNASGQTPLFVACSCEKLEVLGLLLSNGATVTNDIYNYVVRTQWQEGLGMLSIFSNVHPNPISVNHSANRGFSFFNTIRSMF